MTKEFQKQIDWDLLLEGYNDKYGKTYPTLKELFKDIYSSSLNGAGTIEKILGVSNATILTKLRELGFKIKGQGGRNNTSNRNITIERMKKIGLDKIKNMTAKEISGKIGIGQCHICYVCRINNIEYKRIKKS